MPRLTPENKERRARRMREEICRTFAAMAAEEGDVSMERLAEKVGIAKGTIYNYFRDKAELTAAVMESRRELMLAAMEQTIPEQAPPGEQLGRFVRIMIDDFNRHRHLRMEYLRSNPVRAVSKKPRPVDILIRIIERGIARGVFRAQRPEEAALFIFCSLTGKFRHLLLNDLAAIPDEEYRVMMDYLLAALKK